MGRVALINRCDPSSGSKVGLNCGRDAGSTRAFGPGWWHQPGLMGGIVPGWCHEPGPKGGIGPGSCHQPGPMALHSGVVVGV